MAVPRARCFLHDLVVLTYPEVPLCSPGYAGLLLPLLPTDLQGDPFVRPICTFGLNLFPLLLQDLLSHNHCTSFPSEQVCAISFEVPEIFSQTDCPVLFAALSPATLNFPSSLCFPSSSSSGLSHNHSLSQRQVFYKNLSFF